MQTETNKICTLPNYNCDLSIECDTQSLERTVPQQNLVDNISDCDNFNKLNESLSSPVSSQNSDDCNFSKYEFHENSLDVSIIKPDLSDILADWDVDSISSLSPKSNCCVYKNRESKNANIQSFMENISGTTIPPWTSNNSTRTVEHSWDSGGDSGGPSTHSSNRPSSKFSPVLLVLRTRNCNQDEMQKPKELEEKGKTLTNEEGLDRGIVVSFFFK